KGDPESLGSFNSKLITPEIDISAAAEGTVFLAFDSSTRSEEPQEIYITISYDGGAETEILRWTSNPGPTLKADAPNERISLPLNNPPGATTLQVTFGLEKAFNDWWWAIDNIVVDAGAIPPTLTSQPALTIKTIGELASFSVTADGTEPFAFQWYRGTGAGRTAIDGATASTYTIASVEADDTDLYSVDVSNSAATVSSVEALLFVVPPASPSGDIAGQWDFNSGDLSATIGADLLYFDGVGGQTAAETEFGTTTALGIPNIGGAPANVMKFAAANGEMGYVAATGGANGGEGATEKNVYTLIFDVLWPAAANNQWRTFVQIDSLNNGSDGEFFVNTGNAIGVGATGYHGQLTADTWHRVVIAVDQSPGVNRVSYYIDGQLVGSGAGGGLNGRFGLPAAVNFFADDDGDARSGYVSSLQVRNVALNALEAQALGGASAAGIPQTIDTSDLAPLIVTQPNAAFLSPGETLTLSVGALSGTAVTYQWYLNNAIINGATDATLTINNVLPSEAGNYKVVVSNGNGDTTSAEVAVSFPSGITQDLVVHLPFDTDLNDTSGKGNNASTGAGTTPLTAGILGQAVNVSTTIAGGRNYVTLGAPADLNFGTATDFSVSFWVNSPGRSSDPGFIGNKDWGGGGNQGWILYASGNKLGMNIGPNRVDRGGAAQDPEIVGNGWHHVAAVFDRDGLFYAYVDGVLLGTANLAASSRNVDTPATMATNIGEDGTGTYNDITDGSPGFAQGTLIDDVGIWRRRLTPAEVAAIYQGGLSGQNLQLVTGETLGTVAGAAVSNGTSLQFDWRGQPGARLQRNPDVSNPAGWTDVPNTEGQDGIVVPINPAINEFFRLIRPEQP
ncbi:MAG TPA: LamG-like jellyroll fold domain-containing protein, partial [Verrucomicrobiae bacterium]|nr:LamG-like jellyroll fold domain-containing protein [Verrucomicrobiae bacterium]